MLSYHNRLLFPRLRHLGEAQIEHKGDSSKSPYSSRGLYQLDWQSCDALKLDDHIKWGRDQHPGRDLPFVHTLPPIIEETIKNQFFALEYDPYLRAIRSHARMAREVWGARYGVNPLAREQAMAPAEALVWSALWLLSDCAYDPETKYYIRTPTKIVLPHAMAWKFWQYQTGRGVLWRRARMDDLEYRKENVKGDSLDFGKMLEDFISRMREHQDELYAAYGSLSLDQNGMHVPSKG